MDSTLRLKARPPVEDEVENWDDEDFLIDGDDLGFPSLSNSANISNNRRDSQSSFRSDFESVHGEEEKQVHLPDTDEKSTLDAIAAAAKAGIPLPKNVPPSALMGGTIKRLGGRKIRRIIQEDWVEDLEFPDAGQVLQIKKRDGNQFPEVLRQVSNSAQPSPSRPPKDFNMIHTDSKERESTPSSSFIDLERFRDADDDDDFFGDGGATIKVSKRREIPKPLSLITPPTPQKLAGGIVGGDDDFEHDFELPEDGKLRLSAKRDVPPKTPTLISLMEDLDWAEGSLGTRFGGTRRDAQSTRSSSVSAFSPSIASSILESEDETFDGLIIPNGPLDFGERLKRRRQSRSPARAPAEPIKEEPAKEEPVRQKPAIKEEKEEDNEDFLHGLDIGDGEVFDSRKLTLNRNIQVKATRPASPSRPKASVALKFTNKPVTASRLPRPMGPMVSHERSHTQSSLEPVSESGGPIPRAQPRRSLSRMGGHSAHSSVTSLSSVTTPTTPSSTQTVTPSTPRRIELGQRASQVSLRTTEPTTTNAQLLRLKRSLPVMRNTQSPARPPPTRYERPPSRTEQSTRAPPTLRPKTPVERMRTTESAAALARKAPVPFLPAGSSKAQSYNINAKSSRIFRRHDSEPTIEFRPNSRAVSRSTIRSPSPRMYRPTEKVTPDNWGKFSMPRRPRNFGDGHELDAFDDLPTSTQAEAKFLKQPTSAKSQTRTRTYQNILPDRTVTPSPRTPYHHSRVDSVPSFARDTAASRIARETSLAQRNPSGVIAPLTAQRIAQLSAPPPPPRGGFAGPSQSGMSTVRATKKLRRSPQSKPHLISNLNPPRDAKSLFFPCLLAWFPVSNVLQWSRACGTTRTRSGGRATTTTTRCRRLTCRLPRRPQPRSRSTSSASARAPPRARRSSPTSARPRASRSSAAWCSTRRTCAGSSWARRRGRSAATRLTGSTRSTTTMTRTTCSRISPTLRSAPWRRATVAAVAVVVAARASAM